MKFLKQFWDKSTSIIGRNRYCNAPGNWDDCGDRPWLHNLDDYVGILCTRMMMMMEQDYQFAIGIWLLQRSAFLHYLLLIFRQVYCLPSKCRSQARAGFLPSRLYKVL